MAATTPWTAAGHQAGAAGLLTGLSVTQGGAAKAPAPIALHVPSDRTGVTAELALAYTRPTPDAPASLDGIQVQFILDQAKAEIVGLPGAGIAVADGGSVPFFVRVSEVTDALDFPLSGTLLVSSGAAVAKVADVSVTKDPGTAALALVGAGGAGLAFTADADALDATLRIHSSASVRLSPTITASKARAGSGTEVQPTVVQDGKAGAGAAPSATATVDVDAGATAVVLLHAGLPEVGAFSGVLTLALGGHEAAPVPLALTRTGGDTPVTLTAGASRRVDGWWTVAGPVRLDVADSSGRPQTVQIVLDAVVQGDDNAKLDTAKRQPSVTCPHGIAGKGQPPSCSFAANERGPVLLSIPGLPGPGRYTATVLVQRPGRTAKQVDLVVLARLHWWVAVALLVLAALVSLVVSQVLVGSRLKASRRLALEQVRSGLAGVEMPTRVPYGDVRTALDAELQGAEQAIEDAGTDVESRTNALARKVPVLREWVRLELRCDATGAPRDELEAVELQLRSAGMDDAGVTAAQTALRQAELRIIAWTDVQPGVDALQQSVGRWADSFDVGADGQAPVQTPLAAAAQAIEDGKPDDAAAHLRAAQVAWLGLMVRELLDMAAVRPAAVSGQQWKPAADAVAAAVPKLQSPPSPLDPAAAAETFEGAALVVTTTEASVLEKLATDAAAAAAAAGEPKKAAAYGDVAARCGDCLAHAATGDLRGARQNLAAARGAWAALVPKAAVPQGGVGAALLAAEPVVPLPALSPAVSSVGPAATVSRLRTRLRLLNLAVSLVAVALAGVIGYITLYVPNNTWGRGPDIAAAILWGTGFAAAQFTTVGTLRNQLLTPPGGAAPGGGAAA